MDAIRITEAELVEALTKTVAGTDPANARTARELQADFGMSEYTVNRALRTLQAQNRLVAHRVKRVAIDGIARVVHGYTVKPA